MTAIQTLPTDYFIRNRKNLCEQLSEGSLVLLCSGRPPHRTSDQRYDHFADRNFYYLSGARQENEILLIYRNHEHSRTILFIPAGDEIHERWNGRRLTVDQTRSATGIEEVVYLDAFEGMLADLFDSCRIDRVWLDLSMHNEQANELRRKVQELLSRNMQSGKTADLAPIMTQLRMIKSQPEIDRIRTAANLTGEGILAMLTALRPGLSEYHLWSEFQYTLSQAGCLQPAFPTIVAAGEHTLCLHHMRPFGVIQSGDLVQIDVGAIVGGLCADISRVLPASGRFSERQLQIYNLVRQCQETAFETIRPGIRLAEINQACRETAATGLKKLDLLSDPARIDDFFWHGVSHHLGLEVHDVSHREALLQPGMVLTVEPGLYLTEWQIGIRLEDDVVVTEDGCQNLSAGIPREAHEIEALMA